MTEETVVNKTTPQTDELKALKARADLIGLRYHPNIGLAKLKIKVNTQLAKEPEQVKEEKNELKNPHPDEPVVEPLPTSGATFESPDGFVKRETPAQRKIRLRKKASRLVRFRLTCMNENKKKWPGELFTVSNSTVGTFKRFIPFAADSWHCEQMLLNMIKDRQFSTFYEVPGKKGRMVKRTRLAKEFSVEILPPLTSKELTDLRTKQAMANNLGDD